MLRNLIEERKASKESHKDMLGCLINSEENRYILSDEEIIDQIITILYSGYETVSTTSMMAVKYLHDHPIVLEELRVSRGITNVCFFFFFSFLCSSYTYMLIDLTDTYSKFFFAERTFSN